MLPNWTVIEFFTEPENLFGIVFIINEHNKSASVRFRNSF